MRQQLCDALVARAAKPNMVFLTGDLGFMALEPLRESLGERFINAGVAEQNMVSVAAALAREGMEPWVYSIAPFCYARPFEQIRNDVTFHRLPVKLIGNGGGYAYGVMGPTHHAIEDYGILLTLSGMAVFVPVFDQDIDAVIEKAGACTGPLYLRLGRGEAPVGYRIPQYAPWRQLTAGGGPTVIAVGPLAGTYIAAFSEMPDAIRPNLWVVAELPLANNPLPGDLLRQIVQGQGLCVAEEHVRHGGFCSDLALDLIGRGVMPKSFTHLFAREHHYARYGSQAYLRKQAGIDVDSMLAALYR
jgi:transketolase